MPSRGLRRLTLLAAAGIVAALLVGMQPGPAPAATATDAAKAKPKKKKKKKKGVKVKVMTRNVYLGADLGPGLSAPDINSFVNAAGEVVNQVDATNFPVRSQALAQEILTQNPDVVGLQEVALWRTGPTDFTPSGGAIGIEYDFLQLLLNQLNAGGERYRVVVVKDEFDFEAPVNDEGDPDAGLAGADRNARLTMRDVILAKVGKKVKTFNPDSGTFPLLLRVSVGGTDLDVTRGWTSTDVKVGKSKPFHFVNLHHEAFDSGPSNPTNLGTTVGKGEIRQAQAQSLIAPGGPARSKLPVILLGDLNSDDDTVGNDGDVLAYNTLLAGGFRSISTANPLSCCLSDPFLAGGSITDFDHQVDHVMTSAKPKQVKFLSGTVTGRAPVAGGLYPSDHAGVTSLLQVEAKKAKKKRKKGKKK